MLSNIEAEKGIIHILCHFPHKIGEVDGIYIERENFTKCAMREIYDVIKHLVLNAINVEFTSIIATGQELKFHFATKENVVHALEQLFYERISDRNLLTYCKIVRNISIINELMQKLDEAKDIVGESKTAQEALCKVEHLINEFANKGSGESQIIRLSDYVDTTLKEIEESPEIGMSTGLPTYDKLIGGGLRDGTINIIGARSKMGKSQLLLKIAIHRAMAGTPVLYLDTELTTKSQVVRLIGTTSNINFTHLENSQWQKMPIAVENFKKSYDDMKRLPLYYIRIAGMPIEEIVSHIRRFMYSIVRTNVNGKYNKCLICYDYLKLMNANDLGSLKEYEALGYRISELHDLVGEYNAAMLMAIQLNRDGITKSDGSTISGSDRILWLCDSFTILKELTQDEMRATKTIANHKLYISETRYGCGNTDIDYIGIQADKSCGKFVDVGLVRVLKDIKTDGH